MENTSANWSEYEFRKKNWNLIIYRNAISKCTPERGLN